jgi:tetrahydromethanopterin S-methyltransferase subunit F
MARIINRAITSPIYKAIQAYVERYKSEVIGGNKLLDED